MSALAEVVAAVDPAIARYATADIGDGEFGSIVSNPDRLFTLEAVRQGYLLHYGESAVFRAMDSDLCLLAGDALYALGLSRVAAVGDLEAVVLLANLISGVAQAHAENRPADAATMWADSAQRLA